MRLAFVSPMPPARSGIADYSAALVRELERLVQVEVIAEAAAGFDASRFDVALYQVGNNPDHGFVYEMALRSPGVVVLHEANLHHLLADLTIRRGDWDAYLREAEYNGGAEALARAERVRSREAGPDYHGLPMTRRILERARALVVHSRAVEEAVRATGFRGPLARIPHGAGTPEADRWAYRERLGLGPSTLLIGIFGFLKPYKRVPEALRAFRRLLKLEPAARMILVGEPHPDFPVHSLIRTLGLEASVQVLGYAPIEDFVGYMAACDIVLNLRYPTVGESSGSLLRALGLGKPVLVSDVGAFRDLPDDVCLKVPVDGAEEAHIFEFLSLLATRPDWARELGARARQWVQRECSWDKVARAYASFLEDVISGRALGEAQSQSEAAVAAPAPPPVPSRVVVAAEPIEPPPAALPEAVTAEIAMPPVPAPLVPPAPPAAAFVAESPTAAPPAPALATPAPPEIVLQWVPPGPVFRSYAETHLTRLTRTLDITPPGGPEDRVLEMGAYFQITPALKSRLGYGEVRGCYYGQAGTVEHRTVVSESGQAFACEVDLFDAERDPFPYADEHFAAVLCCEVLEHLSADPMHMLGEINRILRPGGHLVLTTPNAASLRAIAAVLQGYHPGLFPQFIKPAQDGVTDPRHNREYTPREIRRLLEDAGFEVTLLETGPFRRQPAPEVAWVRRLLERYELDSDLRGDGIYSVGRKTGPVRARYPEWLYA